MMIRIIDFIVVFPWFEFYSSCVIIIVTIKKKYFEKLCIIVSMATHEPLFPVSRVQLHKKKQIQEKMIWVIHGKPG